MKYRSVITVLMFSAQGDNGVKESVENNYFGIVLSLTFTCYQKLGIILENKVCQKLKLSKNVNNNQCSQKLILIDEGFIWLLTLKSDFD